MKKENIKTHAKNLIAPSIMSFVIAFMLFIYEPITTYASNTEDYWFDLKALLTNNLIIFAIVLIILLLISTFIYFIAKKSKITIEDALVPVDEQEYDVKQNVNTIKLIEF